MEPEYGAYHYYKVATDSCMENKHVSSQKLKRNSINFYKTSEKEIEKFLEKMEKEGAFQGLPIIPEVFLVMRDINVPRF